MDKNKSRNPKEDGIALHSIKHPKGLIKKLAKKIIDNKIKPYVDELYSEEKINKSKKLTNKMILKEKNDKKSTKLVTPIPLLKTQRKKVVDKSKVYEKIKKKIHDECFNRSLDIDPVQLIRMSNEFAILVKKFNVTILETINPDGMQPHERVLKKTFFHMFILSWKSTYLLDDLASSGIQVFDVQNASDVYYIIQSVAPIDTK